MNPFSRLLLTGAVTLLLMGAAFQARAVEIGGHAIAPEFRIDQETLVLNGAGLRTRFVFEVYALALYVRNQTSDAAAVIDSREPRVLTLTLLRDIEADTLLEALSKGLADNHTTEQLTALASSANMFQSLLRRAGTGHKGDTITLYFTETGVAIRFKDQPYGDVQDPAFGSALLRIWLGSKPAQNSLKNALLGKASS